jgi:hypothetical protein
MLLFIPWRRRRRAPTGTRSGSRQTRSRRLLADVADCSFWCNSGSGRTLELGRSGGTLLTSAAAGDASCGVIDNGPVDTPGAEGLTGVLSRRHFAPTFRAGRMLLFIPWRRRRRAPTGTRSGSRH